MLLEYSARGTGGLNLEDSGIFSPHSDETDCDQMNESFCFVLSHNGSFDLGLREFCDEVSATSTPSAVRSSEVQKRSDYDTYDSGFYDSLISDTDLLQMSSLHLGDESFTSSRCSGTFPLPNLCLLSHFDDNCEDEGTKSVKDIFTESSHEWLEVARKKAADVADVFPGERTSVSVRRQRSPDAVVERCSRHRLSLDSYSESRFENHQPVRRRSDTFARTVSTADTSSADLHSVLPPPALGSPLEANLPPPVISEDPEQVNLSPSFVGDKPLSSLVTVPQKTQTDDNQVLEPSPVVTDRVFDQTPITDAVFNDRLRLILSVFAPPCLNQLIGRKMGLDHVDIISELSDRSMLMIVRHICDYLSDADLCRLLPHCIFLCAKAATAFSAS